MKSKNEYRDYKKITLNTDEFTENVVLWMNWDQFCDIYPVNVLTT